MREVRYCEVAHFHFFCGNAAILCGETLRTKGERGRADRGPYFSVFFKHELVNY